jgi:hypothetical protein
MGVDVEAMRRHAADLEEIPAALEKLEAEWAAGTIGVRDYEFNKQYLERRLSEAEMATRELARRQAAGDARGADPKTLAEGVPRW